MFYVEMSCSLCLCENEELVYCFNPCIRFSFTLHVTPRVKAGSDVGEQRSCGSYSMMRWETELEKWIRSPEEEPGRCFPTPTFTS